MTAGRFAKLSAGWFCYHIYGNLPRRLAFGPLGLAILKSASNWAYADEPPLDPNADDNNAPF